MPIQDETIQKFQDLFACTKGFQAVPLTNTPDENGKIKYKYTAFQGPIKTQHYRNHFNTAIGLIGPWQKQKEYWLKITDQNTYTTAHKQ